MSKHEISGMQDIKLEYKGQLMTQLSPIDGEVWCRSALEASMLEELTSGNLELALGFASSLGELACRQQGLDLSPLEDR